MIYTTPASLVQRQNSVDKSVFSNQLFITPGKSRLPSYILEARKQKTSKTELASYWQTQASITRDSSGSVIFRNNGF